MAHVIKIYKDIKTGHKIVQIRDLSYISDRNHTLGWFRLHLRHFTIKILLKWADNVHVPDFSVAMDLVKYYFYPRTKIILDRGLLQQDK